jgi:nucleotide-binding universal stress UspA family protein
VHTRVVAGDPADVIAESSAHAALMVVGRPHRRRVRSWARSVANAVLGHCECPLVVVPESPLPSRRTAPDRTLSPARR